MALLGPAACLSGLHILCTGVMYFPCEWGGNAGARVVCMLGTALLNVCAPHRSVCDTALCLVSRNCTISCQVMWSTAAMLRHRITTMTRQVMWSMAVVMLWPRVTTMKMMMLCRFAPCAAANHFIRLYNILPVRNELAPACLHLSSW